MFDTADAASIRRRTNPQNPLPCPKIKGFFTQNTRKAPCAGVFFRLQGASEQTLRFVCALAHVDTLSFLVVECPAVLGAVIC